MLKREYPILEFDATKEAFIEPRKKVNIKLPDRLVICFFREVIEKLLEEDKISPVVTLHSETEDIVIYKYHDSEVCIVRGHLGGPACGGFLEDYIAIGVNKVMLCGGAGVINKEVTFGKLVVVDSAVRDEGFSYHYLAPSREVEADKEVINIVKTYLDGKNIPYICGKAWTTDAFYRETKDKIALRKEEGCIIVEMEQAGLLAVSQFRNIKYGAIIYGGDDLTGDIWDTRNWRSRIDIRYNLADICKNILLSM